MTPQATARQTLGLGPHTFPPSPPVGVPSGLREGGVKVSIETSQNLDQQKAAGTDKAVTKRTGKNPAKVKIAIWWTFRIDAQVRPMLATWDPEGPDNGGPFRIVHDEAKQRRVSDIIVEKMGETEELNQGSWYRTTFECEQWVPKPKPKAGQGTTTPTSGKEWYQVGKSSPTSGGSSGSSRVRQTSNGEEEIATKSHGVQGPNGPDAQP